jgi:pilus assembly protein CpaB
MLRTMLFLLMGAGLLGFSFVAYEALHPPPPPVTVIPKVTVLAAATVLRAGTLLKPDDIEAREMRDDEAPAGARKDTPQARAELFGAMVRQTLLQHQAVLPADVMRPGDHGFLAAVLTPGKRATSVGVDAVSGTAGLIWPGDHVDLILTQEVMANGGTDVPAGRRVASETVLKDVRVIAIDQQLVQGGGGGGTNGEGTTRTVTLEVTPEDAERVAVATHLGKLSLAVRPVDAAPNADSTTHDVTYGGDVSTALSNANKPVENKDGGSLHVYEGTTDREYKF